MGFWLPSSLISNVKRALRFQKLTSPVNNKSQGARAPRGHVVVYVGDDDGNKIRYVIPISYLNHPLFLDLLSDVDEEYRFIHRVGGLTIPCKEDVFLHLASQIQEDLEL